MQRGDCADYSAAAVAAVVAAAAAAALQRPTLRQTRQRPKGTPLTARRPPPLQVFRRCIRAPQAGLHLHPRTAWRRGGRGRARWGGGEREGRRRGKCGGGGGGGGRGSAAATPAAAHCPRRHMQLCRSGQTTCCKCLHKPCTSTLVMQRPPRHHKPAATLNMPRGSQVVDEAISGVNKWIHQPFKRSCGLLRCDNVNFCLCSAPFRLNCCLGGGGAHFLCFLRHRHQQLPHFHCRCCARHGLCVRRYRRSVGRSSLAKRTRQVHMGHAKQGCSSCCNHSFLLSRRGGLPPSRG